MSTEPQQYVIADLLANAVEPWDSLTAREIKALGASVDPDSPLTTPVVIAAYRNERGPVLIDGSERLQWLASPPRNQKFIPAADVRIDAEAIDEDTAHRAAVALRVNRPHASSSVRAVLARRLHAQFGWSQATIAEVFKVSGPAVSNWLKQLSGSDVPEVTGADGTVYPARGKAAEPDRRGASGTIIDALNALNSLHAEHLTAVAREAPLRQVQIDRHGAADPGAWTVTVPGQAASAAARLADRLRGQADDLLALADKLEQPS